MHSGVLRPLHNSDILKIIKIGSGTILNKNTHVQNRKGVFLTDTERTHSILSNIPGKCRQDFKIKAPC